MGTEADLRFSSFDLEVVDAFDFLPGLPFLVLVVAGFTFFFKANFPAIAAFCNLSSCSNKKDLILSLEVMSLGFRPSLLVTVGSLPAIIFYET
jgi:hypothetical protein